MLTALLISTALAAEQTPESAPSSRVCEVGPITRSYGGSEWLVYSCDDEHTLVFVSAPGSPAMPFVFMSFPEGEGYRLYGEGNGSQDATRPAYEVLSQMTEADRNALLAETRAVTSTSPR